MNTYPCPIAAAALLASLACLHPARAAQSYDNCTGFIDSVPTTITTQGVWCLRHNLGTNIAIGNAITIATNNVTIDCNDYKLGGLAAGNGSNAYGIRATSRQNATVRNCNVRGFFYGILLDGSGAGHLVEDNRLDNNLFVGIFASGDNNRIRRNAVYDTGGRPDYSGAYGIYGQADIADNTVSGVFAVVAPSFPYGIRGFGSNLEIRGNRVKGLAPSSGGNAFGIYVEADSSRIVDNQVTAASAATGFGINGPGAQTACAGNHVTLFSVPYFSCESSTGNTSLP